MWPCFSRMLESNTTTQDKMSYLRMISFCQNMRLQNEEDVKVIETRIQALINSPLTRYDGLLLWNCALSKSNLYISNWGKILAAGLQCSDSFAVKEQCSIVLRKMVLTFGSMTEYSGAFYRFLPELIPILLADSETNQGFIHSCESLTVCMKHFPQLLGSHMAEIETFVMTNLNTDSVQTIETLSELFSTFPRCIHCTFKQKVLFADIFLATYTRTVNTLHGLLNDILSFQNDNIVRVDASPKFEVPCPGEGGIPLMYNKIRSFASLSQCLAKMMSSETGRVRASIEDLLVLIKRMFDFDFNDEVQVNNQDGELALLFLAFPKICDAAFKLLEALVLNFSVEEQASGIMSLVMRAVNISRTSPHASLFYSQLRSTTWKFLNIWINQSGCRVTSEIVSTKLVKELLIEIAVHSTEVNDQTIKLFQYLSCIQALKALGNLCISGGCFFEEKDMEDISTTILRTVRQVQLHLNPSKSFPFPYSNEECRIELYSLLLTCSVSGNPSQMKCTLKSVNLFKIALRDNSIKVKEVCHRGFAFCRYYLHPKKPPPDYMVHPKPSKIDQPVDEDNLLDDWGTGWQNRQLNGHAPAAEDATIPSYPGENSFPEAMEASELALDEQTEQDSPPRYTELGPVGINNKRTFSQQSSQSYGGDSDSDEDKDSSFDEEEEEHPPRKKNYAGAAPRARPTIQILETHSTAHEQQQADEESLDAATNVEKATPEPSDGYEEEEDIAVTENGEPEESDEGEDEYLDEEEDEVEEEEDADFEESERLSPETEEPPIKKQRVETEEVALKEESSLKTEIEEVAKSDEYQEAASKVDHQEAVSNDCQEAVVNDDCQEAIGSDEHRETIGNVEQQQTFGNDDLQESISNDAHQDVGSDNRQGTASTEGHQEESSNDDRRNENISNQEINGEYEDSEESSSNEPVQELPQSKLTVDEMLRDFLLVERKR